jgi:hypothetical protein
MVLILFLHHNTSLEFAVLSILKNMALISCEIQAKYNGALVGFEVFIAVVMNSSVIWDVILCSTLKVIETFQGNMSPPSSGLKSKTRKQHAGGSQKTNRVPSLKHC